VEIGGATFTVQESDERRIEEIQIVKSPPQEKPAE